MEALIEYFTNVPTSFRASLLIGGIVFFWILEGVLPLYRFQYQKVKHAGINLFFTLTTMIIGFGLAGALLWAADYSSSQQIGLLHIWQLPLWAQVVLGILLLDLIGAYFIHWLEHKVRWMWKFHLIHHSDTTVDVTTGLRHHPGETVFRIAFTILAVLVIGAPIGIVMLYQSLSVLFAHLTHANVNMPKGVDRALSYVFITPNMHKVHHHYKQPLTDSNYGNIFAFWDKMFGTFRQVEDSKTLTYGIDTHMKAEENDRLGNLLGIPFQPYRKAEELEAEQIFEVEHQPTTQVNSL
ncbi:sterol desaturase family protein [Porifericola rhodea]|uniref:sterol desaturase family protein n=1 Tax=Porifericola rhodea TaxID=930972 RepID=UPI002665256E|nr:sterol desaturase family protein [Porifericola rhodea]WKN31841.1 sterol desaturase family protein [Porifericola rhodea]